MPSTNRRQNFETNKICKGSQEVEMIQSRLRMYLHKMKLTTTHLVERNEGQQITHL